MKQQTQTPSAPIYPDLEVLRLSDTQQFRLQNISELEALLHSEIECRGALNKKCRRAVNSLDGTCAALGTTCIVSGAVGASLLVSGIGFVVGITRSCQWHCGTTRYRGSLHFALLLHQSCQARGHSCSIEAQHSSQPHIGALEDCEVSNDEYKLILDEVEKYRT